ETDWGSGLRPRAGCRANFFQRRRHAFHTQRIWTGLSGWAGKFGTYIRDSLGQDYADQRYDFPYSLPLELIKCINPQNPFTDQRLGRGLLGSAGVSRARRAGVTDVEHRI